MTLKNTRFVHGPADAYRVAQPTPSGIRYTESRLEKHQQHIARKWQREREEQKKKKGEK